MFTFQQCIRVDWLVAESSRQRKDFAHVFQVVMWIRTKSFAAFAHRVTSPFAHAISQTDTSKGKKLIESCCFVFQLKASQKKQLQAEKFGPHVCPLRKMQGEDCGFDCRKRTKQFSDFFD